jgi:hypothetical protein
MNYENMPLIASKVRSERCRSARDADPDWRAMLPREWAVQVVSPITFSRFRDYEILSERVVGYEDVDQPCYTEHCFVLTDIRSDDDEMYYLAPSYWEHLIAWRLRDGRWLIYRRISCSEDCQQHSTFFSFADEMPR